MPDFPVEPQAPGESASAPSDELDASREIPPEGIVGDADDPSIADTTAIYRRVPPQHCRFVDGDVEVRDGAFKNFPKPERKRMSVVLGDRLVALQRDPRTILEGYEHCGVVVLRAGRLRHEEDQTIQRTPTADEPAHGDVIGEKSAARKKHLAAMAEWVIKPPPPQ
jgi:hypothetical protein